MAEQKEFAPSDKKLRDARKEGNVHKSQGLTQSLVFGGFLCLLPIIARSAWVQNEMLLNCLVNFDVSASSSCLKSFGKLVTTGILGVLISVAIIGTLSEGLQVGFRFEATLLALKGSRLDPVRGMQRMGTGIRECWEVILKGFLLITVSTWHLLTAVEGSIPLLLGGGDRVAWVLGVLWGFLLTTGAVLLLMGGGDYFLRRWRYQRDLSMSRDELRREQKEQDGDPLFRAVRKGMHEALLMQDLERRVRRSKVIVVERNTPSE